ncbi:MAG: hypothetical protein HC842_08765 [Cytophagales bacterium]|nr:hypothetical protein [Cytophagales bacterium]
MDKLLYLLISLPLLGFVSGLLLPRQREKLIARWVMMFSGLHLALAQAFLFHWLWTGREPMDIKGWVLYRHGDFEFFADFYFDRITAAYLFVGSLLFFLVAMYSTYYMHRERDYKRFFNTILLFYSGYVLTVFSGNLETLFVGWELLGISSFLLIAFYRERYLPVKNAVKIYSIYRLGDVGLLLVMWLNHHFWHSNITFAQLQDPSAIHQHLVGHEGLGIAIALLILMAAVAKSALLPFSYWLPRAMEGPTPSSAIFYGSLSVHMGVFLLLRTFPFWEQMWVVRLLVGALGLLTSMLASASARVQSSAKGQVAYASIAQIGLILIEVAAGWEILALVHFAGNAFLRTYQLLISPSVVSYLIREQIYHFQTREHSFESSWPKRMQYTLYILSLKEWNLDTLMYRWLWNPLKRLGAQLDWLAPRRTWAAWLPAYGAGLAMLYFQSKLPAWLLDYLPEFFALVALLLVLKAFAERQRVMVAWWLVAMVHFWVALAVGFNEAFGWDEVAIYLSGVVPCAALGYVCLLHLRRKQLHIDLDRFQGRAHGHPRTAAWFFLACLGLSGFPLTPTFIGEDLVFGHIHADQPLLATLVSLCFIVDGLAIIRIYARVFLGPRSEGEAVYRSA